MNCENIAEKYTKYYHIKTTDTVAVRFAFSYHSLAPLNFFSISADSERHPSRKHYICLLKPSLAALLLIWTGPGIGM